MRMIHHCVCGRAHHSYKSQGFFKPKNVARQNICHGTSDRGFVCKKACFDDPTWPKVKGMMQYWTAAVVIYMAAWLPLIDQNENAYDSKSNTWEENVNRNKIYFFKGSKLIKELKWRSKCLHSNPKGEKNIYLSTCLCLLDILRIKWNNYF